MAAGGGSRPQVSKKPNKYELNVNSLFERWKAMQRRRPELRGVRLELIGKEAPEGTLAYYAHENVKQESGGGQVDLGPTIKVFLPSINKMFKEREAYPRVPGARYQPGDLTKYLASIVKHEAAHAINRRQEDIGRADIPVTKREATPASRLYENTSDWPSTVHEKRFQLINRALGGYGNEPQFSNIGLPAELIRRAFAIPRG